MFDLESLFFICSFRAEALVKPQSKIYKIVKNNKTTGIKYNHIKRIFINAKSPPINPRTRLHRLDPRRR